MAKILKGSMGYVLLAIVLVGIIIIAADRAMPTKGIKVNKAAKPILPLEISPKSDASYSLEELGKQGVPAAEVRVADMEDLYKKYPKEKAGDNMIEAWKKIAPEDKDVFLKGVDDAIRQSEAAVKANPEDKRAKSKLMISSMMKKLAMSNFNCKFTKPAATSVKK